MGDSQLGQHLYSTFVELVSSLYTTGIHQDRRDDREYPGFMYQWRRRCFTAVYSIDKTIATILGRPPLINRHYCVLDPPLDVDDDLPGPQLQAELGSLDEHGWNTDGKRRSTTFIRLQYLLATVREEVLEALLGAHSIDATAGVQ